MPLPTVGGSTDTWGTELNAFELAEHNSDGTHAVISLQGNSKLYSGTGVPAGGTGVDGDWYFRKGGAAGSRVYQKVSGAWQAFAETSPAVQDEGIAQGSAGTLNFTGAGVSASVSGGVATVNVPGGGGGGTGQRTANFLVASSTASAADIAAADYVCDGVADDVQINAALTAAAAASGGGSVQLTNGTFTIAATVAIPNAPVSLIGRGGDASIIKAVSGMTAPLVVVLGPTGPSNYGVNMQRIQYLSIDGSVASGSAAHNLVIAGAVYQGLYEHLDITGAKGHSVYLHSVNTVQTVNIFGSPTGGTFTLTYGAQTTGAIAYNATNGAVQTALRALGLIGTNVTCTGGPLPGTPVTCTFTGALSGLTGLEIPILLPTPSLTGGSGPGIFVLGGERPAYNRIHDCNIDNGQRDGIRSGDVYPTGLYAEHNEFFHNSITFMAGNGIYSTGNNNRIHSNQLDAVDIGIYLFGCENNAIWANTHDRCATHWAKIEQGGLHTFALSLMGDRQGGFATGSRGFYLTGNTSGNKFLGNSVLKTGDVAGGNGWDYGWDEDVGVGNSGAGFWGRDSYVGNAFSFTRNRFNGYPPVLDDSNTSSVLAVSVPTPSWRSGVAFKHMFGTARRGDIPTAAQLTTNAIAGLYNWPTSITALPEATTSLATQLSGITAGTQKRLLSAVYREAFPSLTVANLRLYGYGDVAVTGMDLWSVGTSNTWSTAASPNNANGSFVSSLTVPTFTVDTDSPTITSALLAAPEQVMVDGVMFNKVAAGSTLAVGQWMLDGSRHVVLRTANSAVVGHKIEVTTRQNWCQPGSGGTNLTLDGIYFYGSASGAATAAPLQQNSQADFTIRNCMIGFTHGIAVAGGGAAGLKVLDNVFHNIGSAAIISGSSGTLLSGNIGFNCAGTQNNYAGLLDQSGYDPTWGSCFTKLVGDYTTIRDNIVWNIGFASYWQDVLCRYGSIVNNVTWDGRTSNIVVEVSSYFKVYGNHVFQTGSTQFSATASQGIDISSSRDGDLGPDLDAGEEPNVVMRIGTAYKVGWQMTRTDLPPSNTTNRLSGGFKRVRVHDNIAILRKTGGQGPGGNDLAIQWAEVSGSGLSVGTATTSESGTTATYTVGNNLLPGQLVTVTGCSVAGYNVTNATVVTASATAFTLTLGASGLGAGTGAVVVTGNGSSIADSSNTGWHNMIGFGNGVDNVTGMTWADDFIFYSDVTGLPGQSSGYVMNVGNWQSGRWDTGTDVDGRTHKSRMLTFAEQQRYLNMYGLPAIA